MSAKDPSPGRNAPPSDSPVDVQPGGIRMTMGRGGYRMEGDQPAPTTPPPKPSTARPPTTDQPICRICGRPRANEKDWQTFGEGEGEHLCWDGVDDGCVEKDWVAEVAVLRVRAAAADTLADALRHCATAAGNPDAAEGCRVIIGIARDALAAYDAAKETT